MLKKILIANRGEIACRIIRTARKMGLATVAVYSDADAHAMHVAQAHVAVRIGGSPATESYLRGDGIIAAAKASGADAIHPGYGFLSENADFADAVTKAGLKFIGPSAAAMRALGGKAAAKEIAIKAGVPVVPGYQGEKQDAASLATEARRIGYPVMIKAVAGGGGRGMRLVDAEGDLAELLASAKREAESAFGDGRVLIEKVVERPRHIEVQVFGDALGNVVHLFERDCTLQRRNQKVVEEAPAPGMTAPLREKMCAAAVKLAKAVGYEGAGTVEFLVEGGGLGADARWYFIEMNTRLQVEHPVTEEITGLDLVEWQLRIAAGEKLPLAQGDVEMRGHAIEVRLCAEDPAKGFLPSVGRIAHFEIPCDAAQRLETGVKSGDVVSPFYDSMIAKLIGRGADRAAAISQTIALLDNAFVAGPQTNTAFLAALLEHPGFAAGRIDTGLIGRELDALTRFEGGTSAIVEGARTLLMERSVVNGAPDRAGPQSPWTARDGFQLGQPRRQTLRLVVEDRPTDFDVRWADGKCVVNPIADGSTTGSGDPSEDGEIRLHLADGCAFAICRRRQTIVAWPTYDSASAEEGSGDAVRAPINGRVAKLHVADGEAIEKGARIAVVEAMKMEHVLYAARAGKIGKVAVKEGQQVNQGALIASLADAKA